MDSPGATMALFPNGTETEVSMPYLVTQGQSPRTTRILGWHRDRSLHVIPGDTRTKSSCHQDFVKFGKPGGINGFSRGNYGTLPKWHRDRSLHAIPDDTRTKSSCHQGFVITPTTNTPTTNTPTNQQTNKPTRTSPTRTRARLS